MAWLVARRARARTNRPPTRRRQLGFLRLSMFMARWGGGRAFTPQDLFRQGEAGAHFEAYNPNDLLRRRNLLTYSNQLGNAIWVKAGTTVTPKAATGIDGVTVSADRVVPTAAAASFKEVQQNTGAAAGNYYISSTILKADGYRYVQLLGNSNIFGDFWINFDLQTGVETAANAAGSAFLASVGGRGAIPLGNGYWRLWVNALCLTTGSPNRLGFNVIPDGASVRGVSWASDGVSGVLCDGCMVERASGPTATPSPHQVVTDWNTEYLAAALESVGMWQDATGTTPVTAVEQPVGMWLDSRLGKTWTRGPNQIGSDGTFTGGQGAWVASTPTRANYDFSGGKLRITNANNGASTGFGTASYPATITAGKWYELTLDVTAVGSAAGVAVSSSPVSAGSGTTIITSQPANSVASRKFVFLATVSGVYLNFAVNTATLGEFVEIDNIVFRELPGNHATQATSGQRPILKALYNTVTSSRISDGSWQKVRTGVAVVGTTLTYTAGNANEGVFVNVVNQPSGAWAVTVKASQGTIGSMKVLLKDSSTDTIRASQVFVLTGTDGLYQVAGTTQTTNATTGYRVEVTTNGAAGSINVTGVDVRTADDAAKNIPAFQDVRSTTDYDTDGYPHYLKFDGSDDGLATGSIDFSAFDKVTTWAAITKLSDATVGVVVESSSTSSATAGTFAVFAPDTAAAATFTARSRGTSISSAVSPAAYAAQITAILTALGDIAGDSSSLRVNGVTVRTDNTDEGTGSYTAQPLNIGKRGNNTLPFNGRLQALTVRAASTPASESLITKMNRYDANLMAVTI